MAVKMKRRPLTKVEQEELEARIQRKVKDFRGIDPTMTTGDYHTNACDVAVMSDPPGTGNCPPCPSP